jgi:hypothetical protein
LVNTEIDVENRVVAALQMFSRLYSLGHELNSQESHMKALMLADGLGARTSDETLGALHYVVNHI